MKRSPALAPLSHDHQHALDVALRLRRAEAGTARDAVSAFHAFFAREGSAHFAIEERHILPALPSEDAEWAAGVARVREDHAAIRAGSAALADAVSAADADLVPAARALGELLHAHVRFEERVLFELLERRLEPAELERVGAAVAEAEAQLER